MRDEGLNHAIMRDDARRYGMRLAERTIENYRWDITEAELDRAVAEVTQETLQRVRTLSAGGLPYELAVLWGHEAINGLQDHLLEHSYLRLAARLVSFDPLSADNPERKAERSWFLSRPRPK